MAALPALARSSRYGDVRGTDTAGLGRGRGPDGVAGLRRARPDRARTRSGCGGRRTGADRRRAGRDRVAGRGRAGGVAEHVAGVERSAVGAAADRRPVDPADARHLAAAGSTRSRCGWGARCRRVRRPPTRPGTSRASWPAAGCCWCTTSACWRWWTRGWAAIPDDAFVEVLPLLRRTFGTFAAPERRSIGDAGPGAGRSGRRWSLLTTTIWTPSWPRPSLPRRRAAAGGRDMTTSERMRRWRLVLGGEAEPETGTTLSAAGPVRRRGAGRAVRRRRPASRARNGRPGWGRRRRGWRGGWATSGSTSRAPSSR